MNTQFAKASEVKAGDTLVADSGFDCIESGAHLVVEADDKGGLFVACKEGRHYLEGQLDFDGEGGGIGLLVGLSKPA